MSASLAEPSQKPGYGYDATLWWRLAVIGGLVLAAVMIAILDIMIGSGTLTLARVLAALFDPAAADKASVFIVWDLRMPMTLMAVITGISLSLAGLLMQTILDNPLAEPFTLGVSSAAGFGAALTLGAGFAFSSFLPFLPPELMTALNAFIFALLAVLLVLGLSQGARNVQVITLLGIALHFVFSALLSLVQYTASVDQLQSIVFWLMGSLQRATWLKVSISGAVCLAVLPVVLFHAWQLTALRSFGEQATVFGVRVRRLRTIMLVLSALLAGSVTAVVGIVGFIGLVAPHVARMLTGEDHRFTIAATMAVGAVFATAASLLTKVILPGAVLPLGMVTSLAGLPFFIFLVLRNTRGSLA
ncbi:iron ABC transporter permease [Allorhizobium sp. BGMRC 0089]|uniref:FecCD family ABC transporter permease n=1 Tax=Allorhizobium sonneratiae TaxID=2934936 RepID=UPI0020337012|nr:iron ABC transporter permease [Allorhizobium sonneratiae]MCM2292042.1 iron ABC transporter permease [Allorhizobium sonneratiae]